MGGDSGLRGSPLGTGDWKDGRRPRTPWVSTQDWGPIFTLGSHRSWWLILVIETLVPDGQANKTLGKVMHLLSVPRAQLMATEVRFCPC